MLFGKHINKFYIKYLPFFLAGVVSLVVVDILNLFIPEALGEIVGLMSSGGAVVYQDVIEIALRIFLVGVGMMVGRIFWRLSLFYAAGKMKFDLRCEMYDKANRLSQRYYHQEKVGNIVSWFTSDLETIEDYMGWGSVMLVDAVFLTVLVLFKMFTMSVVLSLLVLFPILLIALWGWLSEKFLSSIWLARQASNDKLYDFTTESFYGIRVIKAFVKEKQQRRAFKKIAKDCQDKSVKVAIISGGMERLLDVILFLIFGMFMIVGGYFVYWVVQGTPKTVFGITVNLTREELVTFMGYFDTLIWPIIALGSVIAMHSRAKASLKRTSSFLDQEEEIVLSDGNVEMPNVRGDISFKNFNFTYPGNDEPSLKNISLDIKAGETIGIVGKIGCGKTTLVDCLMRLYNYEKGTLSIDGVDLMDAKIQSLREAIAYVPQDNFLFSNSVDFNISFSNPDVAEEKIVEAAEFACIDKDISEFKDGYKTVIGERGATVSGGQKQRISMARAYLKDAPILIMDDSVSAVDVKTETKILANIKEKRAGKTTIIIASRISTVSHLDKVIVLNDGEVEGYGSPKELLATSKTYAKMAMLQELEKEEC
ncbi:MAG: ABC transporter ATP-binding protein/permease [Bacilli bacterium]|nr:ABC transporter ATP-binding protein/permease [Bacilli bacterium]